MHQVFSRLGTDLDLSAVQEKILCDPRVGNLIPSSQGLRKMLIPLRDQGRRGEVRIIYYFDERYTVYVLLAYAKASKTDLTLLN